VIELVFPTAAALFLYFVAVPILTIAVSLAIRVFRRNVAHAHEMGSSLVWLLLVSPVAVPSVWLLFAVGHQLDGQHGIVACLAAHDVGIICVDLALVALFVLAPMTFRALRSRRPDTCAAFRPETIAGIRFYRARSVPELVCTRGLWRPRIELDDEVVEALHPDQLTAVLLHERAHARSRDPLRKWLAHLCLSLNPLAALLRRDLARWELGREVRCDLEAVRSGADRFRLAEALIRVARCAPADLGSRCCGLVGVDSLELRVRVLCETSLPDVGPDRATIVAIATLVLLLWPHDGGLGALSWLHHSAEAGWLLVVGG